MTTTNKNASGKSAALDAFKERWKTLAAREQMLVLIAATVVGLAVVWWVLLSPALKTLRTAPAEHAQLDRQLQHMRSLQQEALELQKAPRLQNDDAVRGLQSSLAQVLGSTAQVSIVGDRAERAREQPRTSGRSSLRRLQSRHRVLRSGREE